MRAISDSVALALPDKGDLYATGAAVEAARRGRRELEVRIGVGPCPGDVPLRVLGYAACVAEAVRTDVPGLVRAPDRLAIFSSAPKTGRFDVASAMRAVVAIGGALRISGVTVPISLDLAAPEREVPVSLTVDLPPALADWLTKAGERSDNGTDPLWYAIEHAAPTMFGDLTDHMNPPLRITLGGAPEARFWAVRMRVRSAALRRGLGVAPAVGLILRTLQVPWYSVRPTEPPLTAMSRAPAAALDALDAAANPQRGGNSGLKREARATRRVANSAEVGVLIAALDGISPMIDYAEACELHLAPRLRDAACPLVAVRAHVG